MKNKILNIGPVCKDLIITPEDKNYQTGGAVYYQSHTFSQLKCEYLSIITIAQNDIKLTEDFPDKKNIKIIPTQKTTSYTNIYDKKGRRTQKATLPENPITPDMIKKTNIKLNQYKTAILSPLSKTDIPPGTIKYLKKAGMKTVIPAQGYLRETDTQSNIIKTQWYKKEKYLKYTDILILDEDETKKAFNITKITTDKIEQIIQEYNLEEFIITKAERGSQIYTKENMINIPAIKTDKIVDPTGLGDTYIAAYISKILENKTIKEAGLFAAYTTKEKIETKGPLKTPKEKIEEEIKKKYYKDFFNFKSD